MSRLAKAIHKIAFLIETCYLYALQEEIFLEMFEALKSNESLVELSLANTGMTDTAAALLATTLGRIPS